ncbi:hypothetical protein BDBG_03406 [Blastomyces gilchristii SLH14081]|uniref:Uncharacterized protein n=1 Tax=Blastomyces gilchristii (strain SLH14081) TaxID=559298 RepID=A0A179UH70_BLAGS|nr:uncharacterized protein BDBG_03406 [Blastomyces gilchristii SLH14081]OAT07334.1 hypothetical protein BDBG_03406 [Blastomyces gilchristii SLH14081]
MKFTLLATLALIGTTISAQTLLPNGKDCKEDGSMGICESGYCEQLPKEKTGTCKDLKKDD